MVFIKGYKMSDEHKQRISRANKGKLATPGSFKKGHKVPQEWCDKSSKFNKGKHYSPKTELTMEQTKGEKNNQWKGENVSYSGLHHWVKKWKGKPQICEKCGVTHKDKQLYWANTNHLYKRNLDDWISLCNPCHKKYDKENGNPLIKRTFTSDKRNSLAGTTLQDFSTCPINVFSINYVFNISPFNTASCNTRCLN